MKITSLTPTEALLVAFCGFLIVFIMLAALAVIIGGISKIVERMESKRASSGEALPLPGAMPEAVIGQEDKNVAYGGEIKLIDVDDQTAVCIMAIVSEETGIPLSRLIFKQIKAL